MDWHCLPQNSHKERQEACDSCDCEHSDGCSRGYSYWHEHVPKEKQIVPIIDKFGMIAVKG